jgi:hypothetical protein
VIAPPIRARIHRSRPGCWAFAITDSDGVPFVIGAADTWSEARAQAVGELELFAGVGQAPSAPLVSPDVVGRSWLTRLLLGGPR